ncbi:MAG: hypothetical protein ONB23_07150 [candidate division KSB1 bacterium]|nr:hypothetical protein [candidate division KSB1 bacterium]
MQRRAGSGAKGQQEAGREPQLSPELLEHALQRRVAEIESLVADLRARGCDVERLLEDVYRRNSHLQELWAKVDSDIASRLAEGKASVGEVLDWIESLDQWASAFANALREVCKTATVGNP